MYASLMYATMLATCPDLCYLVGYLVRFTDNPSNEVWDAVIRTSRYIAGTHNYGLHYAPSTSLALRFSVYADSDWAFCINTSCLTGG